MSASDEESGMILPDPEDIEAAAEQKKRLRIDEMADFHARISVLETGHVKLSRRITRIEDGGKGSYSDDPLAGIFSPGFMWVMVLLTLAPIIVDMYKTWKSSSSSSLSE